MTTPNFNDKYDEPGPDGIKWGDEVTAGRGRCGAAGRWGTPSDVLTTQAEFATMLCLIEQRKKRLGL